MNVNGFIKKHSSQLRTISEIVGGGLIIYFTASGTVKAVRKVDAYKKETGRDDLSTKELFQLCWKCYVPAATALASTVTVSAVSEHITRNAHKEQIKGLETAYNLVKRYQLDIYENFHYVINYGRELYSKMELIV